MRKRGRHRIDDPHQYYRQHEEDKEEDDVSFREALATRLLNPVQDPVRAPVDDDCAQSKVEKEFHGPILTAPMQNIKGQVAGLRNQIVFHILKPPYYFYRGSNLNYSQIYHALACSFVHTGSLVGRP